MSHPLIYWVPLKPDGTFVGSANVQRMALFNEDGSDIPLAQLAGGKDQRDTNTASLFALANKSQSA